MFTQAQFDHVEAYFKANLGYDYVGTIKLSQTAKKLQLEVYATDAFQEKLDYKVRCQNGNIYIELMSPEWPSLHEALLPLHNREARERRVLKLRYAEDTEIAKLLTSAYGEAYRKELTKILEATNATLENNG